MERRDLLRALGAAAAVSLLPRTAEAAWAAVAAAPHAPLRTLSAEQAALVGATADTILPRTDTPSASDVGIVAFVDVIVTDQFTDDERSTFLAGLASIDSFAKQAGQGSPGFVGAATPARESYVKELEARGDRRSDPGRAYWRLKSLVIHGYFTSERVMKEVLKVEIMPGRFDGAAPMPAKGGGSDA